MKNKTIYYHTPRDEDYPFNVYDAQLWNLPNNEFLIMLCILSNKTESFFEGDEIWILNRIEIQKRLQKGGMGDRVFRKCWMELQKKKYLVKERIKGGVIWKVYENPSYSLNTPIKTKIQRAPKPKAEMTKTPNVDPPQTIEYLSDRQKAIAMANKDVYKNVHNVDIETLSEKELIDFLTKLKHI